MTQRGFRCIACKRPVEVFPQERRMNPGSVCIPCFWAAKLKYEQGITEVDQILEPQACRLMENFQLANCRWPFDLLDRWQNVDFDKIADKGEEWWFPDVKGA